MTNKKNENQIFLLGFGYTDNRKKIQYHTTFQHTEFNFDALCDFVKIAKKDFGYTKENLRIPLEDKDMEVLIVIFGEYPHNKTLAFLYKILELKNQKEAFFYIMGENKEPIDIEGDQLILQHFHPEIVEEK